LLANKIRKGRNMDEQPQNTPMPDGGDGGEAPQTDGGMGGDAPVPTPTGGEAPTGGEEMGGDKPADNM
jgi:hypothetical protein